MKPEIGLMLHIFVFKKCLFATKREGKKLAYWYRWIYATDSNGR